jgi:hypothetical protein
MGNIGAVYLTLNLVPDAWAEFQQASIRSHIGSSAPIISLSRIRTDFGFNVLQDAPPSLSNIQRQLLRGARLLNTAYVAVLEDDTLYPREHFELRPDSGHFGYNMTRWGLFTWGEPTYFWRNRALNSTLIVERELLIEALEERFRVWPYGMPDTLVGEIGRPAIDRVLNVTPRRAQSLWSTVGVVQFSHPASADPLSRSQRKRMSHVRAFDIPYWGRAEDLVKRFV